MSSRSRIIDRYSSLHSAHADLRYFRALRPRFRFDVRRDGRFYALCRILPRRSRNRT